MEEMIQNQIKLLHKQKVDSLKEMEEKMKQQDEALQILKRSDFRFIDIINGKKNRQNDELNMIDFGHEF